MAHPQNNFTSQFQEDASSGNAALTLNINGVPQTYTPQGTDQTIAISEPVVFEMTDSPTFAEINAVLAEHIPGYLHVAGGGIDYMVPYVGQSGANALYFAMVDAQTEVVRYWICNNGGPWSNGSIGLNNVVDSLAKTSLGQVNTLPISQMISAQFKAGTFLLKSDGDGGSAYTFGNVTIPNGQWYRFQVNGESSSYCTITLDIITGNGASDFGTFKILVDNGAPVQVVRVPYARTTSAIGGQYKPVFADKHGELKPCDMTAYIEGSYLRTWDTESGTGDPVATIRAVANYKNTPVTIPLSAEHPSICAIYIDGPIGDVGAAYKFSVEFTITNNGGTSGGSAVVHISQNILNDTEPMIAEYAQDGLGGYVNVPLNKVQLPNDGGTTKWKVYVDGHAYRVVKLA